ncbi:ATP12 family chaperone protein [Camelimonas abortus]|uniref:ATP12 family chaperone protein n=1 Tax=Camelimonas abortus TaxID=1017184 RepID=A0ABV7LEB6_9HYPH
MGFRAHDGRDPVRLSQQAMQPQLPRRFYREVTVSAGEDGWFSVLLDGRQARTPARRPLRAPTRALAGTIAAEWAAQEKEINPASMPATRMAVAAIDAVEPDPEAALQEIIRYAGSDLLCYRAGGPESLALRQTQLWDPVLAWMDERYGARFALAEGVMFVQQPQAALAAAEAAVRAHAHPFAIAGLHVMTSLAGSVLLALAVREGRLGVAEAWAAAHVDEDHQIALWGEDAEAAQRRARRFTDFRAAADACRAGMAG